MPLTECKILRVNVSDDKLTATVSYNGETITRTISAEDAILAVKELGIVVSADGSANIAEFAACLAEGTVPKPVIVANGIAPVHDTNGRLEKLYEQKKDDAAEEKESDQPEGDKATQSHYDRSTIISVEQDQELVKLIPPVVGKDGLDVYGKPIPRKIGREAKVKLGINVRQDGDMVYAGSNGKLEISNGKIWVNPKLELPGDVDFSVGNIDFGGEVIIAKNVLDLFKVVSHADISVGGIVEAAEIQAGGDVTITGGIAGKEKGKVSAGKSINSKYITNAEVHAGNDIIAMIEIVNCQLTCLGNVLIENGVLIGGHATVGQCVMAKYLGSESGVKGLIEVGINDTIRRKCFEVAPEVKKRRRQAQKIRGIVEPLLANQKYLNAEQKEKATELLYQSYEIEDTIEEMLSELREFYQSYKENPAPEVKVYDTVFPGVVVRFPHIEAEIKQPLKGPLKLMTKKDKGDLTVVAVDENSGSVHTLPSGASHDEFWDTLAGLLNGPAGK